jgi:predicted Zn-dependent protease
MRASFLIIVLSALAASAQQTGQGVNFYSVEKEAALGKDLAAQVQGQTTPIQSMLVADYVNRVGARLAARIDGAPFPYTFVVIAGEGANETHECIAVPGGYAFVPSSLILAAKDEAEFAGMLAHSMVHISERHSSRLATRAEIANQAAIPLISLGGWSGYAIRQAASVQIPAGLMGFQRTFETEADTKAVSIVSAAGFDPAALVRYIGRVPAVEAPGTNARVFAALPAREERVAAMNSAIQALPRTTYAAPNPDEFMRIQDEVRRLAPAQVAAAPRLGITGDRPTLKRR